MTGKKNNPIARTNDRVKSVENCSLSTDSKQSRSCESNEFLKTFIAFSTCHIESKYNTYIKRQQHRTIKSGFRVFIIIAAELFSLHSVLSCSGTSTWQLIDFQCINFVPWESNYNNNVIVEKRKILFLLQTVSLFQFRFYFFHSLHLIDMEVNVMDLFSDRCNEKIFFRSQLVGWIDLWYLWLEALLKRCGIELQSNLYEEFRLSK